MVKVTPPQIPDSKITPPPQWADIPGFPQVLRIWEDLNRYMGGGGEGGE